MQRPHVARRPWHAGAWLASLAALGLWSWSARSGQESKTKPPTDSSAPYVPTPQDVVDEMLRLADVRKNDVVYDLGSGDGRIVVTAARKFGARGVGIELDAELVAQSRAAVAKEKLQDLVTIQQADLFQADVSPATVVTLYLLPHVNRKLRPMLEKQLKPGTRVVSHNFKMRDWTTIKMAEIRCKADDRLHTLYLWQMRQR